MFRLRRRRKAPAATPVVTYAFSYSARFVCTRPWEYQAVRACLHSAVERYAMLERASLTSWDSHTLVAGLQVSVPWAGRQEEAERHADATARYLIACLPVGERLLYLARVGGARLEVADAGAIGRHPDLLALDEHCAAYYGGRDE